MKYKLIMENWRKYTEKEPIEEAGNPEWDGMSIGLLFGGKYVAIAADGEVLKLPNGDLAIFDSREKAVAHIKGVLSVSAPN